LIDNLGEGPRFGHLRICVTAKIRKGETITASKYQFTGKLHRMKEILQGEAT